MQQKVYKYRLKLTKHGELKFISHLDWQNLILKTLRRCELKLVLSEGFNKIPKLSFSPALPIFIESDCELVYFQVSEPICENFKELFEKNTNENVKIKEIVDFSNVEGRLEALDTLIQWAKYEAKPLVNKNESISNFEKLIYNMDKCISSDEILIEKKTKKGINKVVNYRNSLKSFEFCDGKFVFVLKTGQNPDIPAFRADEFLKFVFGEVMFEIKRTCFFDKDLKVL